MLADTVTGGVVERDGGPDDRALDAALLVPHFVEVRGDGRAEGEATLPPEQAEEVHLDIGDVGHYLVHDIAELLVGHAVGLQRIDEPGFRGQRGERIEDFGPTGERLLLTRNLHDRERVAATGNVAGEACHLRPSSCRPGCSPVPHR